MVLRRAALLLAALATIAVSCADGEPPESAPPVSPSTSSSSTTQTSRPSAAPSTKPQDPTDLCARLEAQQPVPLALTSPLAEISGATLSRRSPDAVWVHEDSGREARMVELAFDGGELSRWTVTGVDNVDWEDIAAADDPSGVRHLFVGDVGDNQRRRPNVDIVRFPEPQAADDSGITGEAAVLRLELPDGPADIEALLVDPATADLVLITKEVTGTAQVLVAPGAAWKSHGSTIELDVAGTMRLGLGQAVLAADLGPDGDLVAVRTPFTVFLWPHRPGRPLSETLLGTGPCQAPAVFDPLGEALALLDDGYALVGEGEAAELIIVQ